MHCSNDEAEHIWYGKDVNCKLDKDNEQIEEQANIFAGELLIPEESLNKYYNRMIVPSLSTLAEIFRVSTSVMVARLDYLRKPYFKDAF